MGAKQLTRKNGHTDKQNTHKNIKSVIQQQIYLYKKSSCETIKLKDVSRTNKHFVVLGYKPQKNPVIPLTDHE